MNILNHIMSLPNFLMNNNSSAFLASDSFISSLLSADNILTRVLRAVLQLLYFACKWIMYMVDVIYFYILQLAGVSADTSIIDSANSDMTFKLLIDNKETVTTIIRNFIAIAIVLILVTAIIAIIKTQADAFKDKKAKKNPSGDVLKRVFKSFLMLVLTPLIAIVSIVASSVLLQALFNATNLSKSKSLSARVFNASASAANKYRLYAENGVRIPIKFNFTGDDKDKAINYTVQMIGNDKFPSLLYFDENETFIGTEFSDPVLADTTVEKGKYDSGVEAWRNSVYYKYYDHSNEYSETTTGAGKYKKLVTNANEYYVMSDVIGYALDTMEEYYFVTIQELLESLAANDADKFKEVVRGYNIRLLNSNSGTLFVDGVGNISYENMRKCVLGQGGLTYSYIRYVSKYTKGGTYTYTHVKDAVDEFEGAKFVVAYKNTFSDDFEKSLNGDHYKTASNEYKQADIYYFKESSSARYKKVDLYYIYDEDRQVYKKVANYDSTKEYYYKIGDTYRKVTDTLKDKFYYRDESGNYVKIRFGYDDLYSNSIKEYYLPLAVGVGVNGNTAFTSTYIQTASIITARGLFDKSSYPTAIRRLSNGNIMFYRDDLELVSNGSVSDIGKLEEIEVEGEGNGSESGEKQNVFQKVGSAISSAWNSVKKFVSGLFNPLKLVPDLQLDDSTVSTTYTNKTTSVYVLKDGKLHLSYFFADSLSSKLSSKMYGMDLNCLFDSMSINYIVLVVGSVVFFKVLVTAVFGLINRSINIFLMIMIYPLACATMPLDDEKTQKSGSYSKWMQKYLQLIFSTFGIILSLNFVFIIIPVIDKMQIFTAANLQSNKALGRIANALYNPWTILNVGNFYFEPNYLRISEYLNKILRIIFEIAAFSVIVPSGKSDSSNPTFYDAIQTVVGLGPGVLEDSPIDAVKKTLKTVTRTFNMVFFPHKALKNVAEKSKETLKKIGDNLPGSAVAKQASSKLKQIGIGVQQDAAKAALMSAIKGGGSPEEIEAKLADYKSAYNIK